MKKKVVIVTKNKLARPPYEELEQNKLADNFILWSQSEIALNLADFPLNLGFSPYRFFHIADKNEYFADALDIAKENIASRLLRKNRDGELSNEYVFRQLAMYHRAYKDLMMAKIQTDIQTRMAINVVEIPIIPNCDLVPKREGN